MQTCIELSFPLSSPRRSRNWHKSLRTPQQQRIIAILFFHSSYHSLRVSSFAIPLPIKYSQLHSTAHTPAPNASHVAESEKT